MVPCIQSTDSVLYEKQIFLHLDSPLMHNGHYHQGLPRHRRGLVHTRQYSSTAETESSNEIVTGITENEPENIEEEPVKHSIIQDSETSSGMYRKECVGSCSYPVHLLTGRQDSCRINRFYPDLAPRVKS